MLTQERLKELLYYCPETGVFTYLTNRSQNKKNTIAGCLDHDYLRIRIDNKIYYSHRLAWLYVYGQFPENEIDHKNRIKTDNRIENLRDVFQSCNMRNRPNRIDNISGIKGVGWSKQKQKWRVRIRKNNKEKHLGLCNNLLDAACLRLSAEQCLGWYACDNNSPAFQYVKEHIQKF